MAQPQAGATSLFARTALTITLVSTAFLVFVLGTILLVILIPIAERATREIASLVILSADTWHSLPPERQAGYAARLRDEHGLLIAPLPAGLVPVDRPLPFIRLLREALARPGRGPVEILQSNRAQEQGFYWLRLHGLPEGYAARIAYDHAGIDPPASLALILLVGVAATLVTSVLLARRLTKPLRQLAEATRQIGSGERIPRLPVTGPDELARLVHGFNQMAEQVQDLLANRTTLLAGISHDLRSPLTRIELALEMLERPENRQLVGSLRRDVHQMNRLIGLFMEISRGLHEEPRALTDVVSLVAAVADDWRRLGAEIIWSAEARRCERRVHPLALRRIVGNLLENAVRYGEGKPIDLSCALEGEALRIVVEDQGPGIPESEQEKVFQPFYRLENSRSATTGGSGIGLSVVRQLARANGCRVELMRGAKGGTKAVVTIP